MEYRNSGEATHFGKGVAAGVDGTNGAMLSSNTLQAISDSTGADLILQPKGTGGKLRLGSTVSLQMVSGESTTTIPNMPANSQAVSTMAAAGISTGDMIICTDPRNALSTGVTLSRAYPSAADEITLVWINPHASSIAAESTGITVRWAYLDRT
jgi:hypothetical protein